MKIPEVFLQRSSNDRRTFEIFGPPEDQKALQDNLLSLNKGHLQPSSPEKNRSDRPNAFSSEKPCSEDSTESASQAPDGAI